MELTSLLSKIAPWLAAAAAGPAGLAAQAIKTAAQALGASDTVDSVTAALTGATPEQLAALKTAEFDFKIRMQGLGFENTQALEKIAADDRASARSANVSGGVQGRVFWLIVAIVISVVGIEAAVLFAGIPATVDGQIAGRVLGTLDAILMIAVNYLLGSSASSARKDDLIAAKGGQ